MVYLELDRHCILDASGPSSRWSRKTAVLQLRQEEPRRVKYVRDGELVLPHDSQTQANMNISSSNLHIDDGLVLRGPFAKFVSLIQPLTKTTDINFTPAPSGTIAKPLGLHFQSLVDTSEIPLAFIAGPTQDVTTTSEETLTWFADQLSCADDGEVTRYGVLAAVDAASTGHVKDAVVFTEILFFASPVSGLGNGEMGYTLKALPLNASIPSYLPSPPLSPQRLNQSAPEIEAAFLPPLLQLQTEAQARQTKRKRVESVFDEATERRRRAKRHGGETASAIAAAGEGVNVLVGQKRVKTSGPPRPIPRSHGHSRTTSLSGLDAIKRPLSRSPSLSSDVRPPSRKGPALDAAAAQSKRSGLSRVSSLADTASTEERNKDCISRLVMAGMRLYGLSQRRKRRGSQVQSPMLPPVDKEKEREEKERDEEYKLIYHQTYKGAVFAFRSSIVERTLYKDVGTVQDVVDKLLAMYCCNPLENRGFGD